MKIHRGELTGDGRNAAADDATAPSGRGYGGSRQMPPAPASDFLGDDQWAEQFYEAAGQCAVAELPHDS